MMGQDIRHSRHGENTAYSMYLPFTASRMYLTKNSAANEGGAV